MYRRSPSPSRHRHSSSRRRSPSPRRRSSPGPSRRRDHSRDSRESSRRERSESELPSEFSRNRDDERHEKVEDNRDVLEKMERAYGTGPLQLLHRACKEQSQLKVWTRNFKEIRGICTGFLVAFDKHWNLALRDVDEICLKPKKGKTPYLYEFDIKNIDSIPEAKPKKPKEKKVSVAEPEVKAEKPVAEPPPSKGDEMEIESELEVVPGSDKDGACLGEAAAGAKKKRKRKKKKSKIERRHVKQLFIRGDNVVMASIIMFGDTPAKPAAAQPEQQEESEEAD